MEKMTFEEIAAEFNRYAGSALSRSGFPVESHAMHFGPIATPLICMEDFLEEPSDGTRIDLLMSLNLVQTFAEVVNSLKVNGKCTFEVPDITYEFSYKDGALSTINLCGLRGNLGWFVFRPIPNAFTFYEGERIREAWKAALIHCARNPDYLP